MAWWDAVGRFFKHYALPVGEAVAGTGAALLGQPEIAAPLFGAAIGSGVSAAGGGGLASQAIGGLGGAAGGAALGAVGGSAAAGLGGLAETGGAELGAGLGGMGAVEEAGALSRLGAAGKGALGLMGRHKLATIGLAGGATVVGGGIARLFGGPGGTTTEFFNNKGEFKKGNEAAFAQAVVSAVHGATEDQALGMLRQAEARAQITGNTVKDEIASMLEPALQQDTKMPPAGDLVTMQAMASSFMQPFIDNLKKSAAAQAYALEPFVQRIHSPGIRNLAKIYEQEQMGNVNTLANVLGAQSTLAPWEAMMKLRMGRGGGGGQSAGDLALQALGGK